MAAITCDLAEQGWRAPPEHRRLSKYADAAFPFLEEQRTDYPFAVVDVFDVSAQNLRMKPMEQNRFRLLFEDAVAVSTESFIDYAGSLKIDSSIRGIFEGSAAEAAACKSGRARASARSSAV